MFISRLESFRRARTALALLVGSLFYSALGLTPWWPATWLAPIPLLVAAFHAEGREARLLAWLAVTIGLSSNITYYPKTTGPVAAVVVTLLQVPL
jgi:apolipoprotein N-acyltransferase